MNYDLVFEGGGAKGMALVGAYEAFDAAGHTPGRLLGTSAGAITAALIAAGYTPAEMLDALTERQDGRPVFATFLGQPADITDQELRDSAIRTVLNDIDLKFLPNRVERRVDDALARALARDARFRHLFAFVERGGWYAADAFFAWLTTRLDSGQWNGQPRHFSAMTLGQFFEATRVEVSVVASDTSDGRLLVLNHSTAPGCPLLWAVRMSMSIPLLWDEVIWQASWGAWLGRDLTGHAIVDGGVLSNFPLELFISDAPYVVELVGPRQEIPVLGLLIDEALPVPVLAARRGLLVDVNVKPSELRTVQRLKRIANTATGARDKAVIEAYAHLVVRLPAQGYGTTEFDMSDERRVALLEGGRAAMRAYLERTPVTRDVRGGVVMPPTEAANRVAVRLLQTGT